MNLCNSKKNPITCPIYNGGICFPIVLTPRLHTSMCTQPSFMLVQSAVWVAFTFKAPDTQDSFSSQQEITSFSQSPMGLLFVIINFVNHSSHKFMIIRLLQSFLVIKHPIWCHTRLSQSRKTIDSPVLKRVDLMVAFNSIWKCWRTFGKNLMRVNSTF